jgi:hypothetical protein
MACRNAYQKRTLNNGGEVVSFPVTEIVAEEAVDRLLFGVDTETKANVLLQNNIDHFEWVVRNKIYPNFYARYLDGENALTKDEISFLHKKGCKIAAIYSSTEEKLTEEQGALLAEKIELRAYELGIPAGTAIFLEISENEVASRDFMRGYASNLMIDGYTPGFKANTDAKFNFDREFSRGMQTDRDVFQKCLIWAVAPSEKDYDGITTTHLIHPDNWKPFAPSAITRREIAIWQYGSKCHPIEDDNGKPTTFNLNLVRNEQVIIKKMF